MLIFLSHEVFLQVRKKDNSKGKYGKDLEGSVKDPPRRAEKSTYEKLLNFTSNQGFAI